MGEIPRQEEPDIYRDDLAEEIKETPKEKRKAILESAKENPEYWEARNKKIEGRQNEQEIDDGLGVFIKKKTLYHGSGASGIEKFKAAEDTTVGEGLYCTLKPKDAINYAHHRSNSEKPSVIYEIAIDNMKLLDLRTGENMKKIMQDYKPILRGALKKILADSKERGHMTNIESWRYDFLTDAIKAIDSEDLGHHKIQEVIGKEGDLFTQYARSIGYDGLITIEGGEGDFSKSNHDSYVIFDPEKVEIIKEQKIRKQEKKEK